MSVEVLVDTNVLVYSFDVSEMRKRERATATIAALVDSNRGAVSAQVLAEFFVTARRRFSTVLDLGTAADQVRRYAGMFAVYDTSYAVVEEALRGVVRYGFSYYDAQIWACARLNRIPMILSEDFSDGSTIEGVRFVNPFADGFDPQVLLG
ncbi:MAG: PIN domain-containing protein [Actinomycetota bacterium]|nr:MAG: PilT protein-like [Actinomycetota bacterium]MDO8950536.1 PIN domain-containing protein [Actinomycetota bacterium]MDP3630805.1 PIN domain-containing protein [Actinomycetota bacterium]